MRSIAWPTLCSSLCSCLCSLLLLAACDDKPEAQPAPTPPPSAETKPAEPEPAREVVTDFDVKDLQGQFKCPNKTNKDVCDVLEGFTKGTKWEPSSIQGEEARYFGKAIVRKGDETQEQWVFLVIKKVPLNEVTKGDLPIRIALRDLDKSKVAENNHADKLWWLLKRDDAITKRNQTANHVLDYAPSNWDSAAETKGTSIIFHVGGGAYVRQGEKRTLNMVKIDVAKPGSTTTDGMFVQLYPMSW